MSVQIERLDHNMAKLTIEVEAAKLDKAIMNAYNKQKKDFNIPGFRKGKVPYAMIEKMYGASIFYNDAADELLQAEYPAAVDESGLEIVSTPTVDIVQIEKGQNFIFTAEVAVKPEVTLSQYKGVEVTKIDVTVTDEDVEEEIKKELENNSRQVSVTDRAVKSGDTAVIDFDGYVDGEQFEGGQSEDYSLVIGSGSFIDTFEDQLIGKNPGEELDVNVTFPEDYQAQELAGKPAVFKVKIKEIKEKQVPELDDDFVQEVTEDLDTVDQYRDSIRSKVAERKESNAKYEQQDEAIRKIAQESEMDVPEAMIETQTRQMISQIEQQLAQQGIPMSMYYQFTNTTEESLKEQYKAQAEEQIRSSLVLEAIAKAENLEVSDEEIEDELKKMAESYGMDPKTLLEIASDDDKNNIKNDKLNQKAVEAVMAAVVEVEKAEEAEEASEETTEE